MMEQITEDIIEALKERIDNEVDRILRAFHKRENIDKTFEEWKKGLSRGIYPDDDMALFSLFWMNKPILHVRRGENPLFVKFIEPVGGHNGQRSDCD